MKITLTVSEIDVRPMQGFGDHAVADGACPKCSKTPFAVAGKGMHIESHDTYAADGACLACKNRVGVIRAVCSTIFGLEEDERVLSGIVKVY